MLNIALGQIHCWVGDIEGNCQKVLDALHQAHQQKADLVLFPELTLTGYPPEDLIFRPDLHDRVEQACQRIIQEMPALQALVGLPTLTEQGCCYNSLALLSPEGEQIRYHKQKLPNYGVFDEKRYFVPGTETCVVEVKGHKLGLLICEDLWHVEPAEKAKAAGAELLMVANASPYHSRKTSMRHRVIDQHAAELALPLVYVNHACGQDELLFDGQSMALNAQGKVVYQGPVFKNELAYVSWNGELTSLSESHETLEPLAEIYQGLVMGVRDYVTRNGFEGAVLGLSGGIDSALTLAIAADALGADKVQAVMMPFRYTSEMSIADASEQARLMGVEYDAVSIEPMFDSFMQQLGPMFEGTAKDTTEENLQARSRGVVLMAISNKRRRMVLTTGNKSEMAVGYATLYGDMCGGYAVLKDVPKTMVYALAKYRNTISEIIPERVITRPPSAELAPGQVDQDSLPDYDDLDDMIERYVELDESLADIVAAGYDEQVVRRVIRLIDINEYKRRQSAVGPRITPRGFAKDRRYPICSGFGRVNW